MGGLCLKVSDKLKWYSARNKHASTTVAGWLATLDGWRGQATTNHATTKARLCFPLLQVLLTFCLLLCHASAVVFLSCATLRVTDCAVNDLSKPTVFRDGRSRVPHLFDTQSRHCEEYVCMYVCTGSVCMCSRTNAIHLLLHQFVITAGWRKARGGRSLSRYVYAIPIHTGTYMTYIPVLEYRYAHTHIHTYIHKCTELI